MASALVGFINISLYSGDQTRHVCRALLIFSVCTANMLLDAAKNNRQVHGGRGIFESVQLCRFELALLSVERLHLQGLAAYKPCD